VVVITVTMAIIIRRRLCLCAGQNGQGRCVLVLMRSNWSVVREGVYRT
jgi:hypothetical protein